MVLKRSSNITDSCYRRFRDDSSMRRSITHNLEVKQKIIIH
ncbi:hypothetical protein HRbin04_00243 [archaeon HR04]|nr:hypothetical protein HRbin04_00243 [archaeon HR04]